MRRDVAADFEHDLVAVVHDEPPRIAGAPHPVDIDGDGAPEAGETHARERLAPGEERAEPLAGAAEPDDAGRVRSTSARDSGRRRRCRTERGAADADAGGDDDDVSVREQLEVDAESLPERRVTAGDRRGPARAPAGGRADRLRSASAPGPPARRPRGRERPHRRHGTRASRPHSPSQRFSPPPAAARRIVGRPDRHRRRGADVSPRRLPAGCAGSRRCPDHRCLHRHPARHAADAVQARRRPAQRRPSDHRPARPQHDHPHAPAGLADGRVSTKVTFPSPGPYKVVIDVYPKPTGPAWLVNYQLFTSITVAGTYVPKPLPPFNAEPDGRRRTTSSCTATPHLQAIDPALLDFTVTDAGREAGDVHAVVRRARARDLLPPGIARLLPHARLRARRLRLRERPRHGEGDAARPRHRES